MEKVEQNVIYSFRKVKADVIRLQDEFMQVRENQVRILNQLSKIETKKPQKPIVKVVKPAKKKVVHKKSANKTYVASKEGKKFHDPGCVSLKKVPSNKLILYTSKKKAMAKGLKPCGTCIPR